jgi:hypothetical protein
MSVTDGQVADQTTFNNAFMSKTAESTTTGKENLANADAASGATVTNAQREINSLNSFSGRIAGSAHDVKPVWTSNDVGLSTNDLKARVDLLTALFNNSAGHTHDVVSTGQGGPLVAASATKIGAVNLSGQTFAGLKTFQDGLTSTGTLTTNSKAVLNSTLKIALTDDSTSTGANVDLATPTTVYYKFTNASLTSLRTIVAPTVEGMVLILTNAVGGAIDVKNESGTTAADRILTGTAADISVANNASLFLVYDFGSSRWRIIGGTGSGSGGGAFTTYANENISASGNITSSTTVQMQYRRITGNGAAVTAAIAPFGAGGGWTDGTIIKLVGGSLTNTVTIVHNDNNAGAILNGDCELALYDSLELQYDSTANRWIENSRSIK